MNAYRLIVRVALVTAIAIGAFWLASWLKSPAPASTPPASPSGAEIIGSSLQPLNHAQRIATGAALYEVHCAACHGANLEGQANWQTPDENGIPKAPPHDDTGHTWHHDDNMLINYVKLGGQAMMAQAGVNNFTSGMPGFQSVLSDTQIVEILSFIKSRWSKRSQKVQRDRTHAAQFK